MKRLYRLVILFLILSTLYESTYANSRLKSYQESWVDDWAKVRDKKITHPISVKHNRVLGVDLCDLKCEKRNYLNFMQGECVDLNVKDDFKSSENLMIFDVNHLISKSWMEDVKLSGYSDKLTQECNHFIDDFEKAVESKLDFEIQQLPHKIQSVIVLKQYMILYIFFFILYLTI